MNYLTDLLHATLEVAHGLSGLALLFAAMLFLAYQDERRHARQRRELRRWHARQSRTRVVHLVDPAGGRGKNTPARVASMAKARAAKWERAGARDEQGMG